MLRPFSRFCVRIGAIPESIIKSMSYQEQILKLIWFLKEDVIPAIDQNAEAVEELQEWFDNLDVQEEIDNKLDKMAESGELEEIISSYINLKALLSFDTVADMKNATNVKIGSYCITMGYHTKNDGGSSLYKIREVTNEDTVDEAFIIALTDTSLVAELVLRDGIINPIQMGAYGDNIHDDSVALQKGLNALHIRKATIYDLLGKKYISNTGLHADSMYKCIIKNGVITSNEFNLSENESENFILYTTNEWSERQDPDSGGYCFEDNTIENLTLDCSLQDGVGCFSISTYLRVNINKCDFRRYTTYGIKQNIDQTIDGHELIISDCFFRAYYEDEENTNGIALYLTKPDNIINNLIIVGGLYGIYLTPRAGSNFFDTIHLYRMSSYAIYIEEASYNTFNNIYFDGHGLYFKNPWATTFSNCLFFGTNAFAPISLDKPSGYREVKGLVFDNCQVRFTNTSSQNIITNLNGSFTVPDSGSFENIMNFTMVNNAIDNSYILASTSKNVLSEFTFAEEGYNVDRTQVRIKNGWVYITYQGPSSTHSANDLLITIPEKYRPKNRNFSIPFISNKDYLGVLFYYNGYVRVSNVSSTSAGAINFTWSYPIN